MPRSIQTAEILKRYQNEYKDIQSFDDIREIRAGRLREISLDRAELEIKRPISSIKITLNYLYKAKVGLTLLVVY